jgi:nitrite reductase/ring-hydroxylating ferredoxin subunit
VLEPVADDKTVRAMEYDESETNIVCPWHGHEYSIKTGINQGNPRMRLRKAEMTNRDGEIYVRV